MKGTRSVAKLLALVLCTALVPGIPLPAAAATATLPNVAPAGLRTAPVGFSPATRYRMILPLAGPLDVLSVFGAERDDGERVHMGVDLAAPRLMPVLAVKDGVVTRINRSSVSVFLRHDDGWSSWYLHLNNDTFMTDDGLGSGVAPGLEVGDRVVAGQVIGWVGDSGNAETTPPHLHFEIHTPWGEAIDPLSSLRGAAWVDETVPAHFEGAFWDDDDHEVAPTADLLASLALITGCG
ncbi:MAG: M23 family metallopeptidase, partial [Acidimicrobiia bacterium]